MQRRMSSGLVLLGCLAMLAFAGLPACSDDDSSAAASSSSVSSVANSTSSVASSTSSVASSTSSVASSTSSAASSTSSATSSSSAVAGFIALTFDGTAHNFTAGPTDYIPGADSLAAGIYLIDTDGDNTMIIASATAAPLIDLLGGTVDGAKIHSYDPLVSTSYMEICIGGQIWTTDTSGGSFTLVITANGAVGGTISGTFSGTAVQKAKSRVSISSSAAASSSASTTKTFTGSFSVTRHADLEPV